MITERLREAIAKAEQFPAELQDEIAARLDAIAEELRWNAAMDDPHDLMLDQLLTEARAEVVRGEVTDLDDDL